MEKSGLTANVPMPPQTAPTAPIAPSSSVTSIFPTLHFSQ